MQESQQVKFLLVSPFRDRFDVTTETDRFIESVYWMDPSSIKDKAERKEWLDDHIHVAKKFTNIVNFHDVDMTHLYCTKDDGPYSVALYVVNRAKGGNEEGGWWFDYGTPCEDALACHTRIFMEHWKALLYMDELREIASELNKGRRDINSVLCEGVYQVHVQEGYPKPFPQEPPHYE